MEPTGIKPAGKSRQSKFANERRRFLRHRTHTPAYARVNESPGDSPELSEILDISESGMSIQTSSPLRAEHDLSLCLDLSETKTRIWTKGEVVWSDTSGRAGIRFAQLAGESLDQLKEWLFVNILTAFDHAGATSPAADGRNNTSNQVPASHSMATDEVKSGAAATSTNGNRRATLEAVPSERASEREREEELEPNGFDRETTLQLTAERALALTRATGAAIAMSQGSDSEMICLASAGADAPPCGTRLHVGSGFSGECVRTGRSLRCDDSETDDRVDREGCKSLGIRSMVAVPIRPGNKVAGLLEVFSPQPYAFNANDISALQQLTGSILPALAPIPAAHVSAAPVPVQRPPSPRTLPAAVEPQPAEVRAVSTARPVTAVKASVQLPWHKILLVSAIAIFVFAVVWLIAPWISSQMRGSSRSATQGQAQASKSPNLAVPANDLAGLRKVAERGDPAAQFALGARYATGEEVKQDYTEAVKWFTLAAEQGHILAQATLGAYYWAGRGVPQDLTRAYYWSVLAQAGGDQASKYRVAVLASRMSRSQVLAAQQQANDWLSNFASRSPSSSR